MKSTANESIRVVPINSSMRDVSRVPAEIASRMAVIVERVGRERLLEAFAIESRVAIDRMISGNVPATWAQWQAFQIIERKARDLATGRKRIRTPFRPGIVEPSGAIVLAAPTARQLAKRNHVKRVNAARNQREAEQHEQLREMAAQRKQRETCPCCKGQPSTKKLPPNVVRLTFGERRASADGPKAA